MSRTPIDLKELLARSQKSDGPPKPKFIPKAERERLAAQKAQEEEDKKRKEEERTKKEREEWLYKGRDDRRHPNGSGLNGRKEQQEKDKKMGAKRSADEIEEALWREKYLGPEVNKHSKFSAAKKRMRMSREKFKFGWDDDEDTTRASDTPDDRSRKVYHDWERGGPHRNYDEEAERGLRQWMDMVRREDPETGDKRARETAENWYKCRERYLEPFTRKHWSQKDLDKMKPADWRALKAEFEIVMKGHSAGEYVPNPMRSWRESRLPRRLLDIVDKVGYKEPTAIQRAAIPIALQARDLIGVAVTGSGKTAAFLLPLLVYISDLPPLTETNKNDGPYALILAPTRELVQQIETEARKFADPLGFRVVSIVGGHSLEEQSFALRNGAEIIVATPGRLLDCIERHMLVLVQCCYLIMDEADRMVDLGFEDSVNRILAALPAANEKPDTDDAQDPDLMKRSIDGANRYRQTVMYTATMPPQVERIAKKYLRRPAMVTIGSAGEAVDTIEQRVEFVPGEDRRKKRIREILASNAYAPPIIVFVNIRRNCDAVARDIQSAGWSVVTLHGSKTQDQREAALASVRSGETQVLVATDVAGRGIDVPDVSLVINFNMATSIENYTHRIGRTGRAGKNGVAITFLGEEDTALYYDLRQMLSRSSLSRVPDELRKHEASHVKPVRRAPKADVE